MRWEKATDQGPLGPGPIATWGKFTTYLEIGDDDYAVRQVLEFEDEKFLRYDRTHWADDFGFLSDAQLGKNKARKSQWVVIAIDFAEFDGLWQKAGASKNWQLQMATSQLKKLGSVPPWLSARGIS